MGGMAFVRSSPVGSCPMDNFTIFILEILGSMSFMKLKNDGLFFETCKKCSVGKLASW